jgi:hypothetical protein
LAFSQLDPVVAFPSFPIRTCCGEDIVVELKEQDKVGRVQQKIDALWRALQFEPGAGDAGFSVWFACGEVHYEVHYGIPKKREDW